MSRAIAQWVKLGLAGAALIWGWFAPLDQLLFMLILLDILSGLICAGVNGKVNSDSSYRGMMKKSLILVLVAMAHVLDPYAGTLLQFTAVQLSVSSMVTAFFAVNEAISITENAANAGVPIPRFLRDALEKVKS